MATHHIPQPGKILGINDLGQVITTLEKNDFPEHKWDELGLKLHISQTKLDTIQANNPFNAKACLRGCLTIWLQQGYDVDTHGRPKLEKLAAAVKDMGLRAVSDKILEAEGSSEKRKENDLPRNQITVEADDVYEEFCDLKCNFAHLVADIRGHLEKKVKNKKLEIKKIARFMEHMIVEDVILTDEVSIDPLFTRTKIHYSFNNCLLIKGIVDGYLKKSSCMKKCITRFFMCITCWCISHSTSDDYIIEEMEAYIKKLDHFRLYSLKDLRSNIEAIYYQSSFSSGTASKIEIKLNAAWDEEPFKEFESLLKHYFSRRDIFNHVYIDSGCICISYLVPRSAIAHIINVVKSKSESMHRVGVFYISVDDDAILDKKDNVNFDESLLEAVKLGDTFEVSLLLSLGANPYYEDSNGDSPIILSQMPENKEVAQLFLKLVSDTVDKIPKLISVDEKDNSEDRYKPSCSKEKQIKIQEQSETEKKQSARVLIKEKDKEVPTGIMHLIIQKIWKNQICVAFFIFGIVCSMMVNGNLSIISLVISSLLLFLYVSEIFSEKVTDIVSSVVLFIISTMNLSFRFSFPFRLFTLLANISSAYKQYHSFDQRYQNIYPYIITFLKIFAYNLDFYKVSSTFEKAYCLTSFFCFYFATCRMPLVVSQFIAGFLILWFFNSYLSLFALFATLQLHLFLFLQFFNNTKFTQKEKYVLFLFSYVSSVYYICN